MELYKINPKEFTANCYLFVDEKSGEGAVVDPGVFSDDLKEKIDGKVKKLKYILLTHGHFDHILGVSDLKDYTGAQVAIHKNDAGCLTDGEKSMAAMIRVKQKNVKPDVLLGDGDKISVGDTELSVISTPGHTEGSVCFVCEKEKLIFSGDTLFCQTIGRTDFPGGSYEKIIRSLQLLAKYPDDYAVYAGHEEDTTIGFEKKNNIYMRQL